MDQRLPCVNIRLSLPGKIALVMAILLSIGFGLTLYLCEHAKPQIDFVCPSNEICNSTSVPNVLKYQRCTTSSKNLTNNTWCGKLNCSESSCAQYLFNCGLETSQGISCVSLLFKTGGFCGSRTGSFVLFVLFSVFFAISLLFLVVICIAKLIDL